MSVVYDILNKEKERSSYTLVAKLNRICGFANIPLRSINLSNDIMIYYFFKLVITCEQQTTLVWMLFLCTQNMGIWLQFLRLLTNRVLEKQ